MKDLSLVTTQKFGNIDCDFYSDSKENIFMTREQIGQALEYSNPRDAIYRIHERNADRLNKYSVVVKLSTTDGKTYETYVYSKRGIMEISRYSRQPKADIFMDWVWDVIETIDRTGGYVQQNRTEEFINNYFPSLSEETKKSMLLDLNKQVEKVQKENTQLKTELLELKDNEKKENEYTANDLAAHFNIFSTSHNPHGQIMGALWKEFGSNPQYVRVVKTRLENGKIIDLHYYNEDFRNLVESQLYRFNKGFGQIRLMGRNNKYLRF